MLRAYECDHCQHEWLDAAPEERLGNDHYCIRCGTRDPVMVSGDPLCGYTLREVNEFLKERRAQERKGFSGRGSEPRGVWCIDATQVAEYDTVSEAIANWEAIREDGPDATVTIKMGDKYHEVNICDISVMSLDQFNVL